MRRNLSEAPDQPLDGGSLIFDYSTQFGGSERPFPWKGRCETAKPNEIFFRRDERCRSGAQGCSRQAIQIRRCVSVMIAERNA